MGSEILGLLDNTLTGNYEYFRSNRENVPLQIDIKLAKKPKTFHSPLFKNFRIEIKFPILWKKNKLHRSSISKVIDFERCA